MDTAYQGPERRRAARLAMSLAASVRERGRTPFSVDLVDLSVSGCRVELSCDVAADSWVWLKLPGLEPRYSRVAWCKGGFAGIAFETPLHEAVIDCLAAMDHVPSQAELGQLKRIGERCRAIAARPPDRTDDATIEELLALAAYCEAGASGLERIETG
jgi:hypothetical protein